MRRGFSRKYPWTTDVSLKKSQAHRDLARIVSPEEIRPRRQILSRLRSRQEGCLTRWAFPPFTHLHLELHKSSFKPPAQELSCWQATFGSCIFPFSFLLNFSQPPSACCRLYTPYWWLLNLLHSRVTFDWWDILCLYHPSLASMHP